MSSPIDSQNCPTCGEAIPADSPGGWCPACLLDRLIGEGAPDNPASADTLLHSGALPHGSPPDELRQIGPYQLVEKIGEGGFGVVYRARQTEPILREVALKVIKPGMDSRQIIARFEAERQTLALMEHPNIAGVLDAGTTEAGLPYFVMELVRGQPITEFCDERRLTIRQRLELFIPVCQAVQHAHQKAVLHRDLKPSNILVTEMDGRPIPKVIDFGIAKALGQSAEDLLDASALRTQAGTVIGTPQYMSPEQAGATPDLDTRSDVYTLGVILYELLTGHTPLSREQLKHAAFDEMLRLIRESETRRPSSRLFPVSAAAQTHAIARNTEAKKLSTTLRGDLDWIMLKALEKERERRYGSAAALAVDLDRHLKNEPVEAGPPDALYRMRKLVRRNRVAFGAAAAVLLALCLGLVAALWQATIASQAKNAAERDRDAKDLALHELNRSSEAEKVQRERADAALKETAQVNKAQQDLLRDLSRGDLSGAAKLAEEGQTPAALAHLRRALKLDPSNAAAASFLTTLLSYSSSPLPPVPVSVALSPYKNQISAISGDGRKAVSKDNSKAEIWDTMHSKRIGAVIDQNETLGIVRFDAAGKLLVTTSKDKSAQIWDATTGQPATQPLIHPAPISAAAFAPNGKRLLTVCDDHCVRLWDSQSGKQVGDVLRHDYKVVWAEFGPDEDVCVTVSSGGRDAVYRWDLRGGSVTRHELGSLHWRSRPACSANGRRLAIVSSVDKVKLFDLTQPANRTLEMSIGGEPGELVFHPSGRWLATSSDRSVAVWDCATGARIGSTIVAPGQVTGLALSEDGRRIAVVSGEFDLTAALAIWQVSTGKAAMHPYPLGSVNRGSDGLRFADGDRSIYIAGRNDITKLRLAAGNTVPVFTKIRGAISARSSMKSSIDHSIRMRKGLSSRIRAFSPSQNWLAAADGQRLIFRSRASDPTSESDAIFRAPITSLTASPQGRFLAIQTGEREIAAWDTVQKKADASLVAPGVIKCAAFSGDGRWLACGGERNSGGWVCVWDLNETSALGGGVPRLQPKLEITYPAPVAEVAVNQDGSHMVAGVVSNEHRFLSAFDINGQRKLGQMDFGAVARSLVFSSKGNRVACTNMAGATVWDYMANQGCWLHPPASATTIVRSLAFSADGKRLFTAGYDAMINEWDVSGPLVKDQLPLPKTLRHRTHVNLVHISRDDEWLFTAASHGEDPANETRLWHAPTQLPASVSFSSAIDGSAATFDPSPWFGITEGDGGTWLLAGDNLWESFQGLPCGPDLPPWIPDLVGYAGGVDLGSLGELQTIPATERLAAHGRLRTAIKDGREGDPWIAFLEWYLAEPTDRKLSPHGRQSLHDAFVEASADRNDGRLADLYRLDPRHPLALLAAAREERSQNTAAFLRALAVTRLTTRDPSGSHLTVDAKTALHAGEQLLSQGDAAGAWVVASAEQLAGQFDGAVPSGALRAAALARIGRQQEALVTLQRDSASSGERGEFVRLLFAGSAFMPASDSDALFRSLWKDIWLQVSEIVTMHQADFETRFAKLPLRDAPELTYRGDGRWLAADGADGNVELICLGPDLIDGRSGLLLADITRGDTSTETQMPAMGSRTWRDWIVDWLPGGTFGRTSSTLASKGGRGQFFVPDDATAMVMERTWMSGRWSSWQNIATVSSQPLSKPSSPQNPKPQAQGIPTWQPVHPERDMKTSYPTFVKLEENRITTTGGFAIIERSAARAACLRAQVRFLSSEKRRAAELWLRWSQKPGAHYRLTISPLENGDFAMSIQRHEGGRGFTLAEGVCPAVKMKSDTKIEFGAAGQRLFAKAGDWSLTATSTHEDVTGNVLALGGFNSIFDEPEVLLLDNVPQEMWPPVLRVEPRR